MYESGNILLIMPRYACLIAYVGTSYAGWQIQEAAKAPHTIQGALEKVLHTVTGKLVRVHGAGRTDAGVHAEGQVAHFTCEKAKSSQEWLHIFAALLPPDIRIYDVQEVQDDFHSRFYALGKTYTYSLWLSPKQASCAPDSLNPISPFLPVPPRLHPFVWPCGTLDVPRMRCAIPHLLGTHDFCALQNVGTPMEDTVRTLHHLTLQEGGPWVPASLSAHVLTLEVCGNGFLKQMVRNITGLLVAIGKEKLAPEAIPQLLADKHRPRLPATAPAQGLCLTRVHYTEELFFTKGREVV